MFTSFFPDAESNSTQVPLIAWISVALNKQPAPERELP
jgi:hypothetical protein